VDLDLYGPQVAAVATGLIAAVTRIPRDLPRPFGVVTALVGTASLVGMSRWVAADCLDDCNPSDLEFFAVWVGGGFSGILAATIIAASAADLTRFLGRRKRSEGG
jgi:hypothetical protein